MFMVILVLCGLFIRVIWFVLMFFYDGVLVFMLRMSKVLWFCIGYL